MDKLSKSTSLIYAVILILGGLMKYINAHSLTSLVVGFISGVLIFISCKIGIKNARAGYLYVSAISLVLCGFFAYKFAGTHNFMPSGLMLVLSTITFAVVGLNFLRTIKS